MNDEIVDAIIIGAGPCGLFQAFQLGLQGIRCHIFEAASQPGGQCNELYADKPIYDIPGIPHILAGDLSAKLLEQLQPFSPRFSFNTTVSNIQKISDNNFIATTANGLSVPSRFVIIATGAGAFTPVKLRVDALVPFEDKQLFYNSIPECDNRDVVVAGDTPTAIVTALKLAGQAGSVTYLHRKKRMAGSPDQLNELERKSDAGDINIIQGKVIDAAIADNQVSSLVIQRSDKQQQEIATDLILPRLGNSPKLQDYAHWGLTTEKNHIAVESAGFESNVIGVFITGDINHYPGKRKLILCGFHEATLIAFAIAARMQPDKPVHTQYTTTSTVLLQRLGVTRQ